MLDKLKFIFMKVINAETISYIIFGGLTTLVDAVTFFLFNKVLNVEYIISTVAAWVLAVLFAYITNRIYVFKSCNNAVSEIVKECIKFFIARILSLIFTIIWMYCTVEWIRMDAMISKLLANIFVVVMNYFFSKLLIFKSRID